MTETGDGGGESIRVTLRLAGPVKRVTFQRDAPDPIEEALNDVLHWIWSIRLQSQRLASDIPFELSTLGARGLKGRRSSSQTTCDEHLLLVCAANLDRALQTVPNRIRRELAISKESHRALWLLRNIYEHWNELRRHLRAGTDDAKGTIAKLRKEFPLADPWSFTIDPQNKRIVLADVVDLDALNQELRRLEAQVLRLERARVHAVEQVLSATEQ